MRKLTTLLVTILTFAATAQATQAITPELAVSWNSQNQAKVQYINDTGEFSVYNPTTLAYRATMRNYIDVDSNGSRTCGVTNTVSHQVECWNGQNRQLLNMFNIEQVVVGERFLAIRNQSGEVFVKQLNTAWTQVFTHAVNVNTIAATNTDLCVAYYNGQGNSFIECIDVATNVATDHMFVTGPVNSLVATDGIIAYESVYGYMSWNRNGRVRVSGMDSANSIAASGNTVCYTTDSDEIKCEGGINQVWANPSNQYIGLTVTTDNNGTDRVFVQDTTTGLPVEL